MKSLGEQRREDESEKTVVTLEISAKNANCHAARTGCRVIENASSPARGLGASLPVPVDFRRDRHRCTPVDEGNG